MPFISIVLPARNEETLIKECLLSIVNMCRKHKLSFECIVVVNGSQDQTESIVRSLAKEISQIKIVTSEPGYGTALRKGLTLVKGKYIIIYNVDFYELKFIDMAGVDLLGKDLIIGSKLAHWAEDSRPFQRKVVSKVFNLFLRYLFGFRGSDTHGIKVMRKSVLDKIYPQCLTKSGIFDTEFVLRSQRAGFKIADFPMKIVEKRSSRFPTRIWHTPKDIWDLYRALRFQQSTSKEKQLFYNQIADSWDSVINQKETGKRLAVVYNSLLNGYTIKNKDFLEVGCGLGYFSEEAFRRGANVTGVDIGNKLVEKCKKRVPQANFLTASADDLPFDSNSYDLVLCTEVLEHVENQEKVIHELIRVTKPGGHIILTTPNKVFKPVFDLLSQSKIRPYHGNEHWLYNSEIKQLFEAHSVVLKKEIGFNFFYPHPFLDHFERYPLLYPGMINLGFFFQKKTSRSSF